MKHLALVPLAGLALIAAGCSGDVTPAPTTSSASDSKPAATASSAPSTSAAATGSIKAATSKSDPTNCALMTVSDAERYVGTTMTISEAGTGLLTGKKAPDGASILQNCSMQDATKRKLALYTASQIKDGRQKLKDAIKENTSMGGKVTELSGIGDGAYTIRISDSAPLMAYVVLGDDQSIQAQLMTGDPAKDVANMPTMLKDLVAKARG